MLMYRGKVRICAWRACMDVLPMKFNLARRRVFMDNCCSLCRQHNESTNIYFKTAAWLRHSGLVVWVSGSRRETINSFFLDYLVLQCIPLIWFSISV